MGNFTQPTAPTDSLWKNLFETGDGYFPASTSAGTYFLPVGRTDPVVSTGSIAVMSFFPFTAADYAITGATPNYRLAVTCLTNNTAPAINFTVQMYPLATLTGAGPASTLGAAAGNSVVFTTPAANTVNSGFSTAFTAPANAVYMFCVVLSGSMPASCRVTIKANLQVKYTNDDNFDLTNKAYVDRMIWFYE